jgi:hypothetical protein
MPAKGLFKREKRILKKMFVFFELKKVRSKTNNHLREIKEKKY